MRLFMLIMLIMLVATLLPMLILRGPLNQFDALFKVSLLMLIFVSLLTTIALGYVGDRYQSVVSLYEATPAEELERLTRGGSDPPAESF